QPGEAVDARQADVEDHQVDVGHHERGFGHFGAADGIGDIAVAAQYLGEPVGEQRVVFDDEHVHGRPILRDRLSQGSWRRMAAVNSVSAAMALSLAAWSSCACADECAATPASP